MRPLFVRFLFTCVVGGLAGCSSTFDGSELVDAQVGDSASYPRAYEEFLDTVHPGAAGLVDVTVAQKKVPDYRVLALNYSQTASREQIEILIRELALASDVKRFVGSGCQVDQSRAFNVSVDNQPLTIGTGFSVNEEYCRTGELKWVFISGGRIAEIGWTAEASRSIHLFYDGRFAQEVMPGFTGGVDYLTGRGEPVQRNFGLFLVNGSHDVTIPVGVRNVRNGGPRNGVWTAGWFANERYN